MWVEQRVSKVIVLVTYHIATLSTNSSIEKENWPTSWHISKIVPFDALVMFHYSHEFYNFVRR